MTWSVSCKNAIDPNCHSTDSSVLIVLWEFSWPPNFSKKFLFRNAICWMKFEVIFNWLRHVLSLIFATLRCKSYFFDYNLETCRSQVWAVEVVLDRTLNDEARKGNGTHWWDKFVLHTKDVRSDEFYKLPCHHLNFSFVMFFIFLHKTMLFCCLNCLCQR